MELDDLKASWQRLDERLDRLAAANLRLVTDAQVRQARWRLWPVFVGSLLNILIGGWLAGVFARFWLAHTDTVSALVAGVALHAASIGLIVVGVVRLLIVVRINYARPVVTIQRSLALLDAWEVRSFYWAWLACWLLFLRCWWRAPWRLRMSTCGHARPASF